MPVLKKNREPIPLSAIVRCQEQTADIIKSYQYSYKPRKRKEGIRGLHFDDNVIKRGSILYKEMQEPEQEVYEASEVEETEETVEAPVNHTFWEDDDGEREQMSDADYENFLKEHSLDLGRPSDFIDSLINS